LFNWGAGSHRELRQHSKGKSFIKCAKFTLSHLLI
jgi:hypothetical protein